MKKIAILGYGGRGFHYAKMCKSMPADFEVVAVIDNSKEKLGLAMDTMKLPANRLFGDLDSFLNSAKIADWLFICTVTQFYGH